jgi:dihydroorotase
MRPILEEIRCFSTAVETLQEWWRRLCPLLPWEIAVSHRSGRRSFILAFAASAAGLSLPAAVRAAMGPNDKFDVLVRGGEVLDPSQGLRGPRDIGIRNGVIEAVEQSIPAERALRVVDARGKLVTPGLIDLHAHTYPYGSAIGIPADELIPAQGTTTVVSAGDAGANNFAAFRRFIVGASRTRQYAFVHIANIGLAGFPIAELYNIDYARTEDAARTLAENADVVVGIKVRMSQNVIAKHGLEPLKRAIRAC